MKKKSNQASAKIKRTVASSGQVYYFQGGKRIPAAKAVTKWVRQNFDAIERSKLTEREIKSFRAQEAARKGSEKIRAAAEKRLRFGGKFVNRCLRLILERLQLIGPTSNRDLKKEFPDTKTYGDLLKKIKSQLSEVVIDPTEWGLPGTRGRETYESVIDMAERLFGNDRRNTIADPIYGELTLVVVDERGVEHRGKVPALEAVRDFEVEIIKQIMDTDQSAAFVRFEHTGEIDPETCEFVIDLRKTPYPDPMTSP